MTEDAVPELILWAGSVRGLTLGERMRAARAGGTPPLVGPGVVSDRSGQIPAAWQGRLPGEGTRELLAAVGVPCT